MSKIKPKNDDFDPEEEELPRRHSPDGAFAGVIPYRNMMALVGYYSGFAGLITILGSIVVAIIMGRNGSDPALVSFWTGVAIFAGGGVFSLLAIIFGILGLSYGANNPRAKGKGHAVIGIILGALEMTGLIGVVVIGVPALMSSR